MHNEVYSASVAFVRISANRNSLNGVIKKSLIKMCAFPKVWVELKENSVVH
jgi:hypothetical protein